MKLLYSSHGEASEIYKLCAAKIPEAQELLNVEKTLRAASVDPRGSQVSILDRREIKALVQRSDPRYFLFLRELSVHLKRAYEPTVNRLLSAGYTPVNSLLVRLCDGASPVEILALGVLAGICGVCNLTLSLNRATLMPDTASACRLCGIERVLLCDEISAVGIAAYGTKDILPFDRMICVGSPLLCAAAGIVSEECESVCYPERKMTIFAHFGEGALDRIIADIACLEKGGYPVAVTSNEALALDIDSKYKEVDGIVLLTSSDEETQKILKKCKKQPKMLYGNIPDGVDGTNANNASPLMLAVTAPWSSYPYRATDLLIPPTPDPCSDVTTFASSIASFVEKSVIPDSEIDAIGIRL